MSVPSSNVYLLYRGNSLSADQHHTYWFPNEDRQRAFFLTNGYYRAFNNIQFVRVSNNAVKLPIAKYEIDDNYSYMAIETVQYFEHKAGGGTAQNPHKKMWYAFILNTEYVSDSCTIVYFKIDVLQTFLFGGVTTIGDTMVNRCHQSTDVIGDNRVAEPFNFNPTEINDIEWYPIRYAAVLGLATDTSFEAQSYSIPSTKARAFLYYQRGALSDHFGINAGGQYYRFKNTPAFQGCLREILDSVKTDPNNVLDFYMCPIDALPSRDLDDDTPSLSSIFMEEIAPVAKDFTCHLQPTVNTGLNGYVPRNKKLHTAPFTALNIGTTLGEELQLKFEEFELNEQQQYRPMNFKIQGSWLGTPSLTLVPTHYEGTVNKDGETSPHSGQKYGENYNYTLTLNKFPKCGYNYDQYKQWQAQRQIPEIMTIGTRFGTSLLSGVTSTAGRALGRTMAGFNPQTTVSYATEDLISVGSNSLERFINDNVEMAAKEIELDAKPEYNLQQASADGLSAMNYEHNYFLFQRVTIKRYQAEIIDSFFDQFGYAQNKIMDINGWLSNGAIRPYYKYIKTSNVHVNGNCPALYKEEIAQIFDRGITFWGSTANPADSVTICDYSVNNTVN